MKVCEIFRTIIGESIYAGFPCTIVRFAGCNLRCSYCDTTYSFDNVDEEISADDIIARLGDKWILVTGGEPLLQDNIQNFLYKLVRAGHSVVLETNGSILFDGLPEKVKIIMDVKTPSSKMDHKNEFRNFEYLSFDDEVKIPVADKKDFDYGMWVIKRYNLINITNVSLSPIWDPKSSQTFISPVDLTELILDSALPIRLNIQMHKLIGIK